MASGMASGIAAQWPLHSCGVQLCFLLRHPGVHLGTASTERVGMRQKVRLGTLFGGSGKRPSGRLTVSKNLRNHVRLRPLGGFWETGLVAALL